MPNIKKTDHCKSDVLFDESIILCTFATYSEIGKHGR